MFLDQTDCFSLNIKLWKFLGLWPVNICKYYGYYSKIAVMTFLILYDLLYTINLYFIPRQLDIIVEDTMFFFTLLAVESKVLTFLFMHENIMIILSKLQSDIFQPTTDSEYQIINRAMKFNVKYWTIMTVPSVSTTMIHVFLPLVKHLLFQVNLELPISSYSLISDEWREKFIYSLYFYQIIGIYFHVFCNINIDTFFLGLITLSIAQLDILSNRLRIVANNDETENRPSPHVNNKPKFDVAKENDLVLKLNKCIIHFDEVSKFCMLVQHVFSVTLFIQISMASCIICLCLYRFTVPAPWQYFAFLATYMFVMVMEIMVPCWFGNRIMEKSKSLSEALYDCDWMPRSRRFKSNLIFFVDRTSHPLSLIGWKMLPLTLQTFTSIINTAYSYFTLLRHMQTR